MVEVRWDRASPQPKNERPGEGGKGSLSGASDSLWRDESWEEMRRYKWRKNITYFRFYASCSEIPWDFPYPLSFSPGSLPVGKWTTWLWKGRTSSVCHCLLPRNLSGTSASLEGDLTCNRLQKTWSKSTALISYCLPRLEVSNVVTLQRLVARSLKTALRPIEYSFNSLPGSLFSPAYHCLGNISFLVPLRTVWSLDVQIHPRTLLFAYKHSADCQVRLGTERRLLSTCQQGALPLFLWLVPLTLRLLHIQLLVTAAVVRPTGKEGNICWFPDPSSSL